MGKYIFNKDYETQIRVASNTGVGTGTKQIKIAKNVVVDGNPISSGLTSIKYDGLDLNIDSTYLDEYKGYDGSGINPNGMYTKKDDNKGTVATKENEAVKGSSKRVTTSVFTTKNIVIATIVIGGMIYFLKHKNII